MPPPTPATLARLLKAATREIESLRDAEAAAADAAAADLGRVAAAAARANEAVDALARACGADADSVEEGTAAAAAQAVPLPLSPAVERALEALARVISMGADASRTAGAGAAPQSLMCALRVAGDLARGSPARVAALVRSRPLMEALVAALACRATAAVFAVAWLAAHCVLREATWPELRGAWTSPRSAGSLQALTVGLAGAWSGGAALLSPADRDGSAAVLAVALAKACPPDCGLQRRLLAIDGFGDALCAELARCAGGAPAAPDDMPDGAPAGRGSLVLAAALAGVGLLTPEGADHSSHAVGVASTAFMTQQEDSVPELLLAHAPALPARLVDIVAAGRSWFSAVVEASGAAAAREGAAPGFVRSAAHLARLTLSLFQFAVATLSVMAPALAARADLMPRLAPALLGLARAEVAVAGARLEHRGGAALTDGKVGLLLAMGTVSLLRRLAEGSGAPLLLAERAPGAVADLLRLAALPPLRIAGAEDPLLVIVRQSLCTDAARVLIPMLEPAAAIGAPTSSGASTTALEQAAAALRAEPELLIALGAAVGRDPGGAGAYGRDDPSSLMGAFRVRLVAAHLLALVVKARARGAGGGSGSNDNGGAWLTPLAT